MLLANIRVCFWAVAGLLLISGCASSDSREWQQRTEKDFPAGVSSIITQLGNVLDENTGLGYGTWTVTFGEGGPYATYQCPKDGICEIKIRNLQCAQSGADPAACELILYKNAICEVVIPEKRKTFEIGCPLEVALKDKGSAPIPPEDAAASAAAAAAAAAAAKRSQEAAGAAPPAPKGPAAAAPPTVATADPPPPPLHQAKPPTRTVDMAGRETSRVCVSRADQLPRIFVTATSPAYPASDRRAASRRAWARSGRWR